MFIKTYVVTTIDLKCTSCNNILCNYFIFQLNWKSYIRLTRVFAHCLNFIVICVEFLIWNFQKNVIKSELGEIVATRTQSSRNKGTFGGLSCFLTDLTDKGWSLEYILEGEKLTGRRIMMSRRDREDNLNNYGIEFEGQWRAIQLNKTVP